MNGQLFIVATPIGNMSDISPRAIETLQQVDLILAEDTRDTARLCQRLGIKTPLRSYHKFSEKKNLEPIIEQLLDGKRIALVSDAGTPAVSDPGKYLVRSALEAGITVLPLPGPSAAIAAYSVSGVLQDEFFFCGFLPPKGEVRAKRLDSLLGMGFPLVLYEAPHRISSLLILLQERNARVVICRELTKQFEEVFEWHGGEIKERGEFVVVVEPAEKPPAENDNTAIELVKKSGLTTKEKVTLLRALNSEMKPNDAKKIVMK
ncbi:16S rRNA (cytidine(1402)-2'-O)-methyltransferase [bacterium]|nr:16S rRNA (cytidine(1402)-2'-O)-methyltransferase [bacterium]